MEEEEEEIKERGRVGEKRRRTLKVRMNRKGRRDGGGG